MSKMQACCVTDAHCYVLHRRRPSTAHRYNLRPSALRPSCSSTSHVACVSPQPTQLLGYDWVVVYGPDGQQQQHAASSNINDHELQRATTFVSVGPCEALSPRLLSCSSFGVFLSLSARGRYIWSMCSLAAAEATPVELILLQYNSTNAPCASSRCHRWAPSSTCCVCVCVRCRRVSLQSGVRLAPTIIF